MAGAIAVERPEALLEKAPIDRTGQLGQGMGQVNDLIEPRPEQIRLVCLPPGSHESSRRDPDGSMESRLPGRSTLPEKPSVPSRNRQTRILARTENLRLIRNLAILHGGLDREAVRRKAARRPRTDRQRPVATL